MNAAVDSSTKTLTIPEGRLSRRDTPAPQASDAGSIMAVISRAASDPTMDADKMLKLYDIRDRELARIAEQQFIEAMAIFKANPPKIIKDKHVEFSTSKGVTSYDHATLAAVVAAVIDGLASVGISHSWSLEVEKDVIWVGCVLSHVGGHKNTVKLPGASDDSGSKNRIQAMGSTITYLQRYTLLAAVGLAAGQDDDGHGGGDYERISEQQLADLGALIDEVGANKPKLLEYLKVRQLSDIAATNYSSVVKLVERKRVKS